MEDPVLRRWLFGRALGRYPAPPPFTPHRPPYLEDAPPILAGESADPSDRRQSCPPAPTAPLTLDLPGAREIVQPSDPVGLFERDFADTETLLAVHRFAWLPLLGGHADPGWVDALWQAWRQRYGGQRTGWPWHPYTAGERCLNILGFARRHGIPGEPGDTVPLLVEHIRHVARNLEYFGEHHTGNHLSNNGRCLYVAGLDLNQEWAAERGKHILLAEAERLFMASGLLREGSSHYHLLLTRNYLGTWFAALRHRRAEAAQLGAIARQLVSAAKVLALPGGFPLIGDVSPDCPPRDLRSLATGLPVERDWWSRLDAEDADRLAGIWKAASAPSPSATAGDGWLRHDHGPWSGIWHASPDGWCAMPGHGHQDIGSFELHVGGAPLFIDPGRGAYGSEGNAAYFVSAMAHNGFVIDHADPFPPNRPYYDDAFRREIAGEPPLLAGNGHGVRLRYDTRGMRVERRWTFEDSRLNLTDRVEGSGRHVLRRRFHTPCAVRQEGNSVVLHAGGQDIRLWCGDGGTITIHPATRWIAYGVGEKASVIDIMGEAPLPWSGSVTVEML